MEFFPIENSTAGSVNDVNDLLIEYDNYIVGEVVLKISHALLGLEDSDISDIKKIYSHPQALMQSQAFLNSNRKWQQISMKNTAGAAKKFLKIMILHRRLLPVFTPQKSMDLKY